MKTILTLSFLFLTQNLLLAQYVVGWDTIYTNTNIISEIIDVKLDYFGNTYTISKVGNTSQTTNYAIEKRNEIGNLVWSNDSLVFYGLTSLIGFDNDQNLFITTTISGTNTRRIIKLNKNNGIPISQLVQEYFAHTFSAHEIKSFDDGSFIVIGANSSSFNGFPYIAKYDVNGEREWYNFYTSALKCSFVKCEIIGNKIICFAKGNDPSYIRSHVMAIDLNTGANIWSYPNSNNWGDFTDMIISDNKILMVGRGTRNTNQIFNLLYKIDTNGLNAKAIDSTIINSNYYRKVVSNNNNVFVLSSTTNEIVTLFKFDYNGNKLDSIPLNIYYNHSSDAYHLSEKNFHRHHNLIITVGYRIINNIRERVIVIYDSNSGQISEILDTSPAPTSIGNTWVYSSMNFQGGIAVCGNEFQYNAKIIYYTRPDLSIETLEKNSIKLFPNPTNNIVYLTMSQGVQNTAVKIYNISGQEVLNIPITTLLENETLEIDLTSLAKGFYMVQINNTTQKLVVE